MNVKSLYSEEYYQDIIKKYGYNPFDFNSFDFDIGSQTYDELNIRYLCHQKADKYVATPKNKRVITTGFGMSGVPHLGSISQILRMIKFQEDGERCQIVLGDLDAYNGRDKPLQYTLDLSDQFKDFITSLGFNDQQGIVRGQYSSQPELTNLYLLGKYVKEDNFEQWEEDIHDYYVKRGLVEEKMTLPRKLSLLLMASDFITLGQEYDAVLVMLGVDEHQYVLFSQELKKRIETKSNLRKNFYINTIYSKLNKGFNGHPKMSKSIPGSGITVENTPDEIKDIIMNNDDEENPAESTVLQLMIHLYFFSHEELDQVIHSYHEKNEWDKYKRKFVDFVVEIVDKWN